MATLAVNKPGLGSGANGSATVVTRNDPDGNPDVIPNDGKTLLVLDNRETGKGACSVIIDSKKSCEMGHDHNISISLVADDLVVIGPFPVDRFGSSPAQLDVTYTGTHAGLRVYALSVAG